MDLRSSPRAAVELPVLLTRDRGGPVSARTRDVGAGGARVTTDRPLRVDELMVFDLACEDGTRVDGHCRVLRQQGLNEYALRFEDLDAARLRRLREHVHGME